MYNFKIKNALQDLIIRLQDAEKGYKEIYNGTSNEIFKKWMNKYASERHRFHRELETESAKLGGNPEVKTSFLGELHRMFIDFKLSNIDDSFDSIVSEVERGGSKLIDDYQNVIDNVEMTSDLKLLLEAQKEKIQFEISSLKQLNEELLAVC